MGVSMNTVLQWLADFGLLAFTVGLAFPVLYKIANEFAKVREGEEKDRAWTRVRQQWLMAGIAALEESTREGIRALEDDGRWNAAEREKILEVGRQKFMRLIQNSDLNLLFGNDLDTYADIVKTGIDTELRLEGIISKQRLDK